MTKGVLDKEGNLIWFDTQKIQALKVDGTISGGMISKDAFGDDSSRC